MNAVSVAAKDREIQKLFTLTLSSAFYSYRSIIRVGAFLRLQNFNNISLLESSA
jgi:hypothetical protein